MPRRLIWDDESGIGRGQCRAEGVPELNTSSVMTVNADGGHLAALTKDAGLTGLGVGVQYRLEGSFDPVWSPDGTKILFSHASYNLDGSGQYICGAQVMNTDGTGQAYASPTLRACEHQIDWGTAPLAP